MRAIMLVLTENCNLACRYCYESCDNYNMTFENARKIIDSELAVNKAEDFKIFFFGGEPFVNFNILKQIYDYVEERYLGRVKKYAITTNGTLVHGYIKQWLYERKDNFEITLSLDGTKEMHNRNRVTKSGKESFDSIDLKFFSETWSGCVVKMTISQDTIGDFAKGIKFIEEQGFAVTFMEIMKSLVHKDDLKIGILGAGYISDKLINMLATSEVDGCYIEWVFQRKNVNKITGDILVIHDLEKITKIDMIINTEMAHPVWAMSIHQKHPDVMMHDVEELIRMVDKVI